MNIPFDVSLKNKGPRIAADSGIILWRKNFSYFIIYFAMPFWICAFILRLLPENLLYLAWLILWYLKPLFDRLILQVISVRFFAPDAGIKEINRNLAKNLFRGLPGDLLWRRFSPFRAVFMPMRVLENPSAHSAQDAAKKIMERKKLLAKGGAFYCFFLSVWGLAVEAALLTGEFLFIVMMGQIIGGGYLPYDDNFLSNNELLFFVLWCVNYILIESMYVCMGFGVYINSRIEVEGWDIEILFKSFVKKAGFAEKLRKKKTAVLPVICLLLFFIPAKAFTEEIKPFNQYDEAPIEILEEILSSPDFGSSRNTWRIQLKNPPKERDIPIIDRNKFYSFLDMVEYILASGLRIILAVLAVVIAIILFIFIRKHLIKRKNAAEYKPAVNIVNIERQKDPNELLEKAMFYYAQANHDKAYLRLSWGYITAALIFSLHLYRGFVFPPNATEKDCVNIIKACLLPACAGMNMQAAPAGYNASEQICALIKIWINFAYAGQLPPEGKFEESVKLCNSLIGQNGRTGGNNG